MLSNPKSQEITMIKSALLATAICFSFIVPASAQQAVPCDEASLTKMRTEIDAMTDKAKQAESLQAWEAANTAFKANNIDECNARIGDASKNLPAAPPATTTQ
jgi:long-subunit fatty acid transport protein